MQNNESPLSDKRTMATIIFIGLFFVGWQIYMTKRYPNAGRTAETVAAQNQGAEQTLGADQKADPAVKNFSADGQRATGTTLNPEKTMSFENAEVRFSVSTHGMGLKEMIVKKYKSQEGAPVHLGHSERARLFEMRWAGETQPIGFQIEEKGPGHFVGTAIVGSMRILRELRYQEDQGSFENNVTIFNPGQEVSRGFTFVIPEKTIQSQGSWLFPSYDYQDFFVAQGKLTESVNFNHSREDVKKEYKAVNLVSVGSQYFTSAFLDRSDVLPELTIASSVALGEGIAELTYKPIQLTQEMAFRQTLYAGPKEIDVLKRVDPQMARIIDFGMFEVIAKPLLYIMKWFHGIVGNWGVAIILLTLLVRFVVLPFNVMSLRSMKAMQKIQPLMTELRSRYKDDPMTLNREMMALMKQHKANPLGGCLPMLLQIPIFFALFRVIGSSVELYQSPFIFWITDLSLYDKFYLLPVLMGGTMYLQQKMTPTAMDPAQAKIMQFLPVIFTAFMLQLPSGLTLYMLISSVFGIIQQWYFTRGHSEPALAK